MTSRRPQKDRGEKTYFPKRMPPRMQKKKRRSKAASRVKKIRNSYGVVLTVFTVAVSEGALATKNL